MPQARHPSKPPEIPRLLERLQAFDIRYVLAGSVAAKIYGADVPQPGDLDVVPATERENLERLAALLLEIEAGIEGASGHWETTAMGEKRWVEEEIGVDEQAQRAAAWYPDPGTLASMDHLFRTRYGNFDVVPEISGSYEMLAPRAVSVNAFGFEIVVAHVDDLLATLTVPRREKDAPKVRQLRAIQRQRGLR